MADATSTQDCIDRHVAYPFDIATRLKPLQRARMAAMVAPVRPGELVLDVGCNSGYLPEFLPAGCECCGVDVSPALVDEAKKRLLFATVAPAESLPFDDKSVDVVVLGEILEHVFDPAAVVREAMRVARRLVVGSTPHEAGKWGTDSVPDHKFHVRCFTDATLREALADLQDVSVSTVPAPPQFYVFAGGV